MDSGNFDQVMDAAQLFRADRLMLLLIGIVFLVLIVKAIEKVAGFIYVRFPLRRLLALQIVTSITFLIYIFGTPFLVYAVLSPPKELMIAVGGSVAVALGLSLKDLVASVIAGFILLFDRPFLVGDRVTFGDVYGDIKSIGLRAVRVVTLDDNVVTIPNNRFMNDVVASGNAGALDMMVVMNFHLRLDADIVKARDILYEVLVTSRFVYLNKPVNTVVAEVAVAEQIVIQLSAKAYVLDTRFEKDFQTDVVLRATEAFSAAGIMRPLHLKKISSEV